MVDFMPNTFVIPGGTQVEITHSGGEKKSLVMREDLMLQNPEPVGGAILRFQLCQWQLFVPKDAVVPVREEDGRFEGPTVC